MYAARDLAVLVTTVLFDPVKICLLTCGCGTFELEIASSSLLILESVLVAESDS